jgi:hypothetical protein
VEQEAPRTFWGGGGAEPPEPEAAPMVIAGSNESNDASQGHVGGGEDLYEDRGESTADTGAGGDGDDEEDDELEADAVESAVAAARAAQTARLAAQIARLKKASGSVDGDDAAPAAAATAAADNQPPAVVAAEDDEDAETEGEVDPCGEPSAPAQRPPPPRPLASLRAPSTQQLLPGASVKRQVHLCRVLLGHAQVRVRRVAHRR